MTDRFTGLPRRAWLQLAATQAVVASWPAWATARTVTFEADPFKLGVASGQPSATSVVLWTRLLAANPVRNPWKDQPVAVAWELAEDERFERVIQRGEAVALPELSHSVHVDAEGLPANRVFWYRFRSGEAISPVGRTRTLPAPGDDVTPLKVAFASCQRYHSGSFVAYDHMLADAPDLVVFLGDYIYEMGATQNENRGSWLNPANKIADYRELYELAKSDPALQRMHAWCPWLIIWDDHEVLNDYAGEPVRLQGEGGKVARRMEMGYRTWYEHMPFSMRALVGGVKGLLDNSKPLQIHGTYRWGQLANFHMLDTRQYRSVQVGCGVSGLFDPKGCDGLGSPQRQMLGGEQSAWLEQQFRANAVHQPSHVRWNFICQPSVFSKFVIPMLGGKQNHDNWDGYPEARARLIAALANHQTANPVILGGDIHQNWVTHVHRDVDDVGSPVVAPEFCATSITTPSFGRFTAAEMKALAPHCLYADRHQRGYLLATVTLQKLTVHVRHVDLASNVVKTSASFEVVAGRPNIQQVA